MILQIFCLLFCVSVVVGTVTLSGEERTLVCPGDTVKYSCHSSNPVSSITWHLGLLCLNERNADITISVLNMITNELHTCSSNSGEMASFNLTVTYELLMNSAYSNISVTTLDTHYSITNTESVSIDCEASNNFRYIDLTGTPLPPSNISYKFEDTCDQTFIPTLFWWSAPQSDERNHHSAARYTLNITTADEDLSAVTLYSTESNNVTVPLWYNMTYNVELYATSCGSRMKSSVISIDINSTYDNQTRLCDHDLKSCPVILAESYFTLTFLVNTSSVLSFQCLEGMVPQQTVTAVCGQDGRWSQDPDNHNCTPEMKSGSFNTLLVVISGALGIVTVMLISITALSLIVIIKLKKKVKSTAEPEVVYEEVQSERQPVVSKGSGRESAVVQVQLNENVAYVGVHGVN